MRFLHTMIRVGDLDASVQFYCGILGMRELRRKDFPDGRFTLVFLGYGDESEVTAVELTHNWDTKEYDMGTAFGHLAIEVEDVYEACEKIRSQGGSIVREAGPMKHGSAVLAFVEDPDGYKIELLPAKMKL